MIRLCIYILALLSPLNGVVLLAQEDVKTFTPKKEISKGPSDSALYAGDNTLENDTLKLYVLPDFVNRKFTKKSDQRKYDHLVEIVKKVYPLAKLAGVRMEEYAA